MIRFDHDAIDVTKLGDKWDAYELGPLKAYVWRIRIPVRLARWIAGI